MTDRDRLIELLHLAPTEFGKTKNDLTDNRCFVEFAADYLLANGVIVPPCKVGDMVYRIVGDGSVIAWDIISMECFVDEIGFVDDSDNWIDFDDFGKTVFITKKEAEAKLKELECSE